LLSCCTGRARRPAGGRDDRADALDPATQETAAPRIGGLDDLDLGTVRAHDRDVLDRRPRVDDTDEAQTEDGTCLREADPHVARARLDDTLSGPRSPPRMPQERDSWRPGP
jgi:hypothetical protein